MKRLTASVVIALTLAGAISASGVSAASAAGTTATINIHVIQDGGAPFPSFENAYIKACPVAGGACVNGLSGFPRDNFAVTVTAGVDYTLCLEGGFLTNIISECWNDGAPLTLAGDQVLTIDWEILIGGSITGAVYYFDEGLGAVTGASGAEVTLLRRAADGSYQFYDKTQAAIGFPRFRFTAVIPGTYALYFRSGGLNPEYWDDARYFAQRTDVVVTPNQFINLSDVTLSNRSLDISRIDGADRFDVGVSVSQELLFGAVGSPVVYIANGYNFPDALSAGPAASLQYGVVLLVEPNSIPAAVAAELTRIHPGRIVVAGGPASVSPAVFEQLRGFLVGPPGNLVRAGGLDRYEASRSIVRDAFGTTGATMAIIATGANFPDALTAGPAASSQDGPVILVDGTASSIDSATQDLIEDLGIQRIYIAGGTGSVSPGIEASLKLLLGDANVVRFAGQDRFEVGVLISQEFFANSDYAFVTTGYKFPDALTGGPLAAWYGGPLYLSTPECLPAAVAFDILDVGAQAVVLLGGPGSLSPAVENLELC